MRSRCGLPLKYWSNVSSWAGSTSAMKASTSVILSVKRIRSAQVGSVSASIWTIMGSRRLSSGAWWHRRRCPASRMSKRSGKVCSGMSPAGRRAMVCGVGWGRFGCFSKRVRMAFSSSSSATPRIACSQHSGVNQGLRWYCIRMASPNRWRTVSGCRSCWPSRRKGRICASVVIMSARHHRLPGRCGGFPLRETLG